MKMVEAFNKTAFICTSCFLLHGLTVNFLNMGFIPDKAGVEVNVAWCESLDFSDMLAYNSTVNSICTVGAALTITVTQNAHPHKPTHTDTGTSPVFSSLLILIHCGYS